LHVFIIPGLILALVSMHLRLVLTNGINEYPKPGHPVRRETYPAVYKELIRKEGVPFVPYAVGKDLVFAAIVIIGILLCAGIFGPKGPGGPPDPTIVNTNPRPDFYFLAVFAALALLPEWMEIIALFVLPVLLIGYLIALPFIANTGEKSFRRRPVAVLSVIMIMLTLFTLNYYGQKSPWSPAMGAWSGNPVPVQYLQHRTPLQLRGALVLQNKQCRNCHKLGNEGGERGPALDGVAARLTRPELIRQVIQGGGNMPAYGKKLSPAEVDALASFMETLRRPDEAPARETSPPLQPDVRRHS
ncbi:MAG: ubiquinol-cytochrome c reductase cytochrome b subunit, partial [Bryobacterales bacterium]|nr:ubiquinol-cytochrome c reductase cytochrome b subunit [Bryobacterales bacterium]